MNKLGKIAPIIVVIVSLGSLYLAFRLDAMKKAQVRQITELNDSVTQTTAELNRAKGTLKQAQADLTKAKSDLEQTNAVLVTTKTALDQKTQEASALQTQLTDVTNQLAATKADLATAQGTIKNIRTGWRRWALRTSATSRSFVTGSCPWEKRTRSSASSSW